MHSCPKIWLKFFKAVCDRNRQKILQILKERGELNASEITKLLRLSQPTVSHHLKILCDAEVIQARKSQREVYYVLKSQKISSCCRNFMKFFDCKSKRK